MNEIQKQNQTVSTPPSQRNTQISEVIRSKEPTFYAIKKAGEMKALEYEIIQKILTFLKLNFLQSKNPDFANTAMQFSADIIISEPTWKLSDVDALLTFVRTRRDLLSDKFSKEINSIKFMEWVVSYNMEKADAREQYNRKKYNEKIDAGKQSAKIKEYVKRVLKTVNDAAPKITYTHTPQKLFDPIIFEADYNQFLKLIPELPEEDKKKFHTDIFNFQSIIEPEMKRRETLLNLLK